jgi:hypothetical protein
MGKRSRRQGGESPEAAPAPPPIRGSGARARKARLKERAANASVQAEKMIKQRPAAPWDPFPLTELSIFFGFVLFIAGAVIGGGSGKGLMASGVVLICIGGLETMLREHFSGYRSHAGVLTGMLALAVLIFTTAVFKIGIAVRGALVIGVFVVVYPALRRGFIRKSGGQRVL